MISISCPAAQALQCLRPRAVAVDQGLVEGDFRGEGWGEGEAAGFKPPPVRTCNPVRVWICEATLLAVLLVARRRAALFQILLVVLFSRPEFRCRLYLGNNRLLKVTRSGFAVA